MSATPIPRTLALVLYENMNYIKIADKPEERLVTKTGVYSDKFRITYIALSKSILMKVHRSIGCVRGLMIILMIIYSQLNISQR